MDFSRRSYQQELIDQPGISFDDIRKNMEELDVINSYLGGHSISIRGLRKLLSNSRDASSPEIWEICELGCGGGDNLRALSRWCSKNNIQAHFTGIDINPNCILYAQKRQEDLDARFIVSDYRDVVFETKPDIIFSSLFCHHFKDEELIFMLNWMQQHAVTGFFINDLHRNAFAYYAIKLITSLFSSSRLVKNDAPLSVLRGFRRKEWEVLFLSAGTSSIDMSWQWAFRWLIIQSLPVKQSEGIQ